jgi:hypothetical protein
MAFTCVVQLVEFIDMIQLVIFTEWFT